MGTQDIVTKEYMKDEHRFADAFNYYLFHGEQVVQADKLKEVDPVELGIILDGKDNESVQKIRDVLKKALLLTDDRCNYLLLGIENQSEVHFAMPVRNLIFDGLRYGEQVSRRAKERRKLKIAEDSAEFLSGFGRDDRIKPVITLVIYWKAGPWDGPRSLYDMFGLVDDRLKEYINNYKLHIIVPNEIDDFDKFKTELGVAFEFIANSQKRDGMEAIKQNSKFMEVSYETVNLLNICTNTHIECNNERGVVNVCKGIEDMKDYARQEGREEGRNMELVDAIERIAKNAGGLKAACDLYGTTIEHFQTVKKSLAAQ